MDELELKTFLDEKALEYEQKRFIESDPISIPHHFAQKEDIEIAAFLVASIAWGKREMIIKNGNRLMQMMDERPHQFLMESSRQEWQHFHTFVHRTFNSRATLYFLNAIKDIYQNHNGLEAVFSNGYSHEQSIHGALLHFRNAFLLNDFDREFASSHVANVAKNSACKRINMFLRWMVRDSKRGVDFGLWKDIPTSALMIPLDLHSGGVSRKLGLLTRKQDDWKSVAELTNKLRLMDANDPIKYDFALFGLGVFERFQHEQ